MRILSKSEVVKRLGIRPTTFQGWIERGVITPIIQEGRGRNKGAKFSEEQFNALSVVVPMWREQQCGLDYLRQKLEEAINVAGS